MNAAGPSGGRPFRVPRARPLAPGTGRATSPTARMSRSPGLRRVGRVTDEGQRRTLRPGPPVRDERDRRHRHEM